MKTRTLLLLSVTCGLAILLAGTIQLVRLAGQAESATLGIGDTGNAGDAVIVVDAYAEDATQATVTVTLSWKGANDAPGLDGFGLANVAKVAPVDASEGAGSGDAACTAFTAEPVQCTLTFSTEGFEGPSRQLVFRRAEEQVRWKLK